MARGKQTCRILKDIRRQIAQANDIEFATSECTYKGDCLGTCPKCEAEVRYLEQQLRQRSLAGKLVKVAGISAVAATMLASCSVHSPKYDKSPVTDYTDTCQDALTIKGTVFERPYKDLQDSAIHYEPLIGVSILNKRTGKSTLTDIDARFQIPACKGDTLEIRYIGYYSTSVTISDNDTLEVYLSPDTTTVLGEIVVGAFGPQRKPKNILDLYIVDENDKPINDKSVMIERVYIDEDGDEDSDYLSESLMDDEEFIRFYWADDPDFRDENDKPLKEATLRITVEGYEEPVTIKVKYPKRKTKKKIKFRRKQK